MSELSYLEKLLDGVEVEWLPLGHIAAIKTGQSVNKNMISKNPGVYPVINSGREPLGFINTWNTDNDPIGITTRGAGVGSVIWQEGKYFRGNLNYSITIDKKNHINIRYMYHALLHMKNDIHELCTFDGIPALNAGSLKKLLIPIPCPDNPEKSLAIQSEIVRILDKFTALTAELTAELNMRKKQYNYYRDQLLNLEGRENTREMRIGDIYDFQYGTGNTIPKSGGQYPVYGSNGIVGSHDKYNSEDSPVIGHIGAYAGIVNWGQGKHFVTYNGVICRHKSKEVLQKYAYYLLLLQDFGSKSNSASQPFVSYNILNAPIVLVPPLQEQARIVAILDKFDTLTNSITEGLPREIELRQKQYEYYRDLLFSFPKPETASN
ncbi:TPA: restriction endonuclease subunit S [Escherichia coli]|nr:restriction endonuclease subunit S [Escherichia coli]